MNDPAGKEYAFWIRVDPMTLVRSCVTRCETEEEIQSWIETIWAVTSVSKRGDIFVTEWRE